MRAKARIRTRNRWWKRRRRSFAATIDAKPGNLPGFLFRAWPSFRALMVGAADLPLSPETIIPAGIEAVGPIATGRPRLFAKRRRSNNGIGRADEAKKKSHAAPRPISHN